MHIKNQVVLVTGGARGLGLAITHALINEGARVVVNYLNTSSSTNLSSAVSRTGFYLPSRCYRQCSSQKYV